MLSISKNMKSTKAKLNSDALLLKRIDKKSGVLNPLKTNQIPSRNYTVTKVRTFCLVVVHKVYFSTEYF